MPAKSASLFAFVVAVALTACGAAPAPTTATYGQAQTQTYPQNADPPGVPEVLTIVKPTFKASLTRTVDDVIAQKVREVPGVAAVARFALAKVTLGTPAGPTEITVAGIDPIEFRPLAPEVTAQATFVWRKLLSSEMVLAHEEHRRLDLDAGESTKVMTPSGTKDIRIGAVAANGVPNLAGAMVSLVTGGSIEVFDPRSMLIGLAPGANEKAVSRAIQDILLVKPEKILPPAGRAYATGKNSDKLIGSFSYVANPDGTITQDPAWVKKNIVTRTVPIIGKVTCHRVLIPQLASALKEIQDRGLAKAIDPSQFAGCYVPRFIGRDASKPISMHAWGLALDINAVDNPQGAEPKMDLGVVEIFERWGFRWGGRWSPPDGHHFEMSALITG